MLHVFRESVFLGSVLHVRQGDDGSRGGHLRFWNSRAPACVWCLDDRCAHRDWRGNAAGRDGRVEQRERKERGREGRIDGVRMRTERKGERGGER